MARITGLRPSHFLRRILALLKPSPGRLAPKRYRLAQVCPRLAHRLAQVCPRFAHRFARGFCRAPRARAASKLMRAPARTHTHARAHANTLTLTLTLTLTHTHTLTLTNNKYDQLTATPLGCIPRCGCDVEVLTGRGQSVVRLFCSLRPPPSLGRIYEKRRAVWRLC